MWAVREASGVTLIERSHWNGEKHFPLHDPSRTLNTIDAGCQDTLVDCIGVLTRTSTSTFLASPRSPTTSASTLVEITQASAHSILHDLRSSPKSPSTQGSANQTARHKDDRRSTWSWASVHGQDQEPDEALGKAKSALAERDGLSREALGAAPPFPVTLIHPREDHSLRSDSV